MKLYQAAASPFVRKVLITAKELELDKQIELVDIVVAPGTDNQDFADKVNPLGKIPALVLDDGTAIVDSSIICEYLNELDGHNKLIPEQSQLRWGVKTAQAVADGMMDAAVLIRYETFLRPDEKRWDKWQDAQWGKINASLAWFEARKQHKMETLAEIALASALGYLDFRYAQFNWRKSYPDISTWHKSIANRGSYTSTAPE